MAAPEAVGDSDFQAKVLEASTPVLVDFWAEWCGPCKMIAPIVDELAEEYDGRVGFAKVDVDANPMTPGTYGVRGIPTLLVFNGRRGSRTHRRVPPEVGPGRGPGPGAERGITRSRRVHAAGGAQGQVIPAPDCGCPRVRALQRYC